MKDEEEEKVNCPDCGGSVIGPINYGPGDPEHYECSDNSFDEKGRREGPCTWVGYGHELI
jgi:hypothetical protein